jgi:hypothetical protein
MTNLSNKLKLKLNTERSSKQKEIHTIIGLPDQVASAKISHHKSIIQKKQIYLRKKKSNSQDKN